MIFKVMTSLFRRINFFGIACQLRSWSLFATLLICNLFLVVAIKSVNKLNAGLKSLSLLHRETTS